MERTGRGIGVEPECGEPGVDNFRDPAIERTVRRRQIDREIASSVHDKRAEAEAGVVGPLAEGPDRRAAVVQIPLIEGEIGQEDQKGADKKGAQDPPPCRQQFHQNQIPKGIPMG